MSVLKKSNKASILATVPFRIRFIYHPPTSHQAPSVPSSYAASITTSTHSLCPSPSASPSQNFHLATDFSACRSTSYAYKHPLPKPRTNLNNGCTSVAKEALQQLIHCGKDHKSIENVLLHFESRFCGSGDYAFLLRELAKRGDCATGIRCFEFALRREKIKHEKGKLANAMIRTLDGLGRVDLAKSVFDNALNAGYGKSVYLFSALISAYGRNGYCDEALGIFDFMKKIGLKPNIVTYSAVIDACAKGDVEFKQVLQIYDEMLSNGLQPDQFTFGSLIDACSRKGLWEVARDFFKEMVSRGIHPDIINYNTYLNVIVKGGKMDMASEIISEMHKKSILPNVITYNIMIDGYVKLENFEKAFGMMSEMLRRAILPNDISCSTIINGLVQAGRLDDARYLFNEMKVLGVCLDNSSYNTLISVYAKLGMLKDALDIFKEMKNAGIKGNVVTYTSLLDGYGKQLKYDEMRKVLEEMKSEHVLPNSVMYSTLINVYCQGGLYKEATDVLREFKQSGLKANVVIYTALIDALCKNGLVEFAMILLDDMIKEGVNPNIVTYTSIVDGLGRSVAAYHVIDEVDETIKLQVKSLCSVWKSIESQVVNIEDYKGIEIFGQLASKRAYKENEGGKRKILCILAVFGKMREFGIRQDVAMFSSVLNACCKCDSFEDACLLLKELQLFDPHVYGVTYGLLVGCRENVWPQAQSLFDNVKLMDSPTACSFYDSLTNMLWHFNQKQVAQLVVVEAKHRQVWKNMRSDCHLDLHLISAGTACSMVHLWLFNLRSMMCEGHELPKDLRIVTGWGKHSKVVGDSPLRLAVKELLTQMGAPFSSTKCNRGEFIATGSEVFAWLRESDTLELLTLDDKRTQVENVEVEQTCHKPSTSWQES